MQQGLKYCAYLRKSRADRDAEMRGEEETLSRHKRILEEFAASHQMLISRFYAEVVSGETIRDRPVVRELLRDVESGQWNGVLVVEVERLARGNTKDQGVVAEAFQYSGTKIITPFKSYDPNNEFDEEYFEFGLFMSRREYKTINRRLQRGRVASVQEGNFVTSCAPYGYRRVKNTDKKGYTLAIMAQEATVVNHMFEWYGIGRVQEDGSMKRLGTTAIATLLDLMGVVPPIAKHWSPSSIRDILKNEVYLGNVKLGKRKIVKTSHDGVITVTRKNQQEYLVAKGKHEAIVSTQLFEKVQELLSENRKNTFPNDSTIQNPLSGLLYCQKCGNLMTRQGANAHMKYATLRCPKKCGNVSAPLYLVEEEVVHFLHAWTAAYVPYAQSDMDSPLMIKLKTEKQVLEQLVQEKNKMTAQYERACDLVEQGIYQISEFMHRQTILSAKSSTLQMNIEAIQKKITNLERFEASEKEELPKAGTLLSHYAYNTPQEKNALLRELIEKIEYRKDIPNTKGKGHLADFSLAIYPKIPAATDPL
ncbi:MAG: recombinase family protein [Lachnospiraceae bacterium]|nr:recombinase family protein [Lachnospiraceae bacterium]